MSARILLVEDEPDVRLVVEDLLMAEGHAVECAADGHEGMRRATGGTFDLLILDVMLPGPGGFEICRAAREGGFQGAILFLTARGQPVDRVQGLNLGADDYLVKPFDPDELVARVAALLRRVRRGPSVTRVEFGSITANFARGEFTKDDAPLHLTTKEADLLRYFVTHRGDELSREEILRAVWSETQFVTPRTVDVHVAWLRQKIEHDQHAPAHIKTIRGVGYRFDW